MQNATQAVVDGHMEPIGKQETTQQLTVTGQYLFENFVQDNDGDMTRMKMVCELVSSADSMQMAGATDSMVKLARNLDLANGTPEKGDDGKRTRGPKEASAMNVRTIIRQVWGALKFVDPMVQIDAGLDRSTGYLSARVIAKSLLEQSRINWDNSPVKTEKDKEVARLRKANAVETKALVEVQKDNPRLPDESLKDWQARTLEVAEAAMESARAQSRIDTATKVVQSIVEKHGRDTAMAILVKLADELGFDLGIEEEPSEEEANKMLADVALAEAIAEGSVEEVIEETA